MSLKSKSLFSLLIAVTILSCSPKTAKMPKAPVQPSEPDAWNTTKPDATNPDEETVEVMLDDLVVGASAEGGMLDSIPKYNASATKTFDLEHTEIRISFDFAKKHAPAQATLTLKPWFHATDQLVLDAKNFEIKKVTLLNGTDLKYKYDGIQMTITLDRKYKRDEQVKVRIDYVARPDDRQEIGGSAAISSDKGLYFIDPEGTDPEKPTQVWTQGETESSSRWFPTIDKPNQRTTQEIYITVADKYKTLSNGVLVSAKKNADGTRTDYYKMDKPHAPYLFMMAVGEYAKVSDKWRGIPVDYYVEPKFEAAARDIFPHTPEMLEFFSTKLGYAYPWPSYSQVICRDYVSGAMENTSAVIFGEFVQNDKRTLLESHWTNEKIVAHEMFHHWFGDLVTCESWSNLTLNEGFANYSEYLWLEHKHGREEADMHLEEEHGGFMGMNEDGGHPPIHYRYNDKEDMFDAVSYNKGGSILHMLRKYLGDEAFFSGLQYYLKKHEYTDVESDELRMAMEEVSGEDLHWFFDQWYLRGGFPVLDIAYDYDAASKTAIMRVKQLQNLNAKDQTYVFDLPLYVDVYKKDGSRTRESVRITKREQEFKFMVAEKPLLLNFDAEKALVCQKNDAHTPDEWVALMKYGPLYADRNEALQQYESLNAAQRSEVIKLALQDKSRGIRKTALALSKDIPAETLKRLAANDADPTVRAEAIEQFGKIATLNDLSLFKANLGSDKPYGVVGAALKALEQVSRDSAIAASVALQNEENDDLASKLAQLYHNTGSAQYLSWYQKAAKSADFEPAFSFFEHYQKYLLKLNNVEALSDAVQTWKTTATDSGQSAWRRFSATKAIADTRNDLKKRGRLDEAAQKQLDTCAQAIKDIKAGEKDKTLLMYYEMF
jgi:aminopeptidase N